MCQKIFLFVKCIRFSVAKATLESQMSVCLSVCQSVSLLQKPTFIICKLPPQDRGVGKIRDAKTEQTMTKIKDAKTEQTMTSQECLRMRAQYQSKGDSKVLFLIF